jgi:hypothetical protein
MSCHAVTSTHSQAHPQGLTQCLTHLSHVMHTPASSTPHGRISIWHVHCTMHGAAQHSMAQHSMAQHSTAWHSTAQHSMAQHDACHPTGGHIPKRPLIGPWQFMEHSRAQHGTSWGCTKGALIIEGCIMCIAHVQPRIQPCACMPVADPVYSSSAVQLYVNVQLSSSGVACKP